MRRSPVRKTRNTLAGVPTWGRGVPVGVGRRGPGGCRPGGRAWPPAARSPAGPVPGAIPRAVPGAAPGAEPSASPPCGCLPAAPATVTSHAPPRSPRPHRPGRSTRPFPRGVRGTPRPPSPDTPSSRHAPRPAATAAGSRGRRVPRVRPYGTRRAGHGRRRRAASARAPARPGATARAGRPACTRSPDRATNAPWRPRSRAARAAAPSPRPRRGTPRASPCRDRRNRAP